MDSHTNRSLFTRRALLGALPAAVLAGGSLPVLAGPYRSRENEGVHEEFPSHDPSRVRAVVGAAHSDLEKVRGLVTSSPALAKTAWDWGFGDWESALGAASHMGRRDIAEFLISHGARPNLFTFAMLGHVDTVRACVRSMPGVQRIPGPHGISLLQHARSGKKESESVVDYLSELGDADPRATSLPLSDEDKQTYLGRYEFGDGANDVFEVVTNRRGALAIKRGEGFGRVLNRVEEHAFAPGGAADVRIRFRIRDGKPLSLTVHDPEPIVTGVFSGSSN